MRVQEKSINPHLHIDIKTAQDMSRGKKMEIVVHMMEYSGGPVHTHLHLRNYSNRDFDAYKRIYNECFFDMRTALQRFPVDCCDSKEDLEKKRDKNFVLEIDGSLVGSVAVYGSEIDDLIVAKKFQRMGYGEALLRYAVSYLQSNSISPIVLHVADWNQGAIKMYLKNGFSIAKTEIV